uniref:AlNc14C17G1812 protein n=1 Tax=Albugo laibachii Nc14 TaxID=890382 RepID=F0W4J2_9STRA|nr:AlNc14C17G1812 [Albugo laibachii Nc14]|eukprot:CCA16025.1 AlNc14C17G1812 [Albugo laibachii Nc14]
MHSNTAIVGQAQVSGEVHFEATISHQPKVTPLCLQKRSAFEDYGVERHQSRLNLTKPDRTPSFDTTIVQKQTSRCQSMVPEGSQISQPRIPVQSIGRLPLKRFDSADLVLQSISKESECSSKVESKLAKLIIDRHNYTTCQFIHTHADNSST